ncbi:MAG: ankyrin repeat domain-containing protein [Alphaproteobacteria bacterium]|nr:MAG: ankyrin repeat domain-containing protein [Alphaproteobacteria bacterium]
MTLKDIFRRAVYYLVRGRPLDKRLVVQIRTAIGMDDPAPIPGLLAQNPQPDDIFGWDSRSPEETTPLFLALASKKLKAAGALLEARPEWLELRNRNGQTPLQRLALNCEDPETFKFLHEKGADMEATDKNGGNVTMMAIRHSALNAATILIGLGGRVDLDDPVIEIQLRVATDEMNLPFLKAIGTLREEQKRQQKANLEADIGAMHEGLAAPLTVKTLRLKKAEL